MVGLVSGIEVDTVGASGSVMGMPVVGGEDGRGRLVLGGAEMGNKCQDID